MNIRRFIAELPDRTLTFRIAMLASAVGFAYGATIIFAARSQGAVGIACVSLAAGSCFASAVAALILSTQFADPRYGALGALLPMTARTGLPLVLALVVRLKGQGLVASGFVYYLIAFYLLALAIELPMSLPARPRRADEWKSEGRRANG